MNETLKYETSARDTQIDPRKMTPRTELATESHVFSEEDNQEEEVEAAAAGADSHRANHRLDGLGGDGPKGADKQYA
jgi:hypothetical protein